MGQPLDRAQLRRLFLEHLDEFPPDDPALFFRVRHPREPLQESLFGIDPQHIDAHALRKGLHHLQAFALAQQAVIHKHADQLGADGLMQQGGDNGGIHAAGQGQQHLVPAHLGADAGDGLLPRRRHVPAAIATRHLARETLQDGLPLGGVGDFRVKLEAVKAAGLVRHAGDGGVRRGGDDLESLRQGVDPVAVAHPHMQQAMPGGVGFILQVPQQPGMAPGPRHGVAELAPGGVAHRAA